MAKGLIIAEKPSVAHDIAEALGGFTKQGGVFESNDLIISSARGHLAGLSVPEAKDFPPLPIIPKSFAVVPLEGCKDSLGELRRLIQRSDVDTLINACDAGREGELIFYLIYTYIGINKPVKRMWLQSMTANAILSAYKTMRPGSAWAGMCDAARSRAEADWLVGINGSRALSKFLRKKGEVIAKVSVGRVQTPTLAMIVRRENEIVSFQAKDYYEIHSTFSAEAGTYIGRYRHGGHTTTTKLSSSADEGTDKSGSVFRIGSLEEVQAIIGKCSDEAKCQVEEASDAASSAPPKLFDLTTLQREANRLFGFTAKQTLDLAQVLYEAKVTTYPRTDSQCLPEDYVLKVEEIVKSLQNDEYHGSHADRIVKEGWVEGNSKNKKIFNDAKISDHFAIIPTGALPKALNDAQQKIYKLVLSRFLASFYPAAKYLVTRRTTKLDDLIFESRGKILKDGGWLEVYGKVVDEDEEETTLCPVQENELVKLVKAEQKALKTKPPAHYNEATLLSAMEHAGSEINDDEDARDAMKGHGLGTPATRAPTIEGLIAKEFIFRAKKYILPTTKGNQIVGFLLNNGLDDLTQPKLTGEWEHRLELMAKGQWSRSDFMEGIAENTRKIVSTFESRENEIKPEHACAECGSALLRRESKFKKNEFYWSCSGYPKCNMILLDNKGIPGEKREAKAPAQLSEHKCPDCGKPLIFRTGTGKRGLWKFWGCSGYPKCNTKCDDQGGVPVVKRVKNHE